MRNNLAKCRGAKNFTSAKFKRRKHQLSFLTHRGHHLLQHHFHRLSIASKTSLNHVKTNGLSLLTYDSTGLWLSCLGLFVRDGAFYTTVHLVSKLQYMYLTFHLNNYMYVVTVLDYDCYAWICWDVMVHSSTPQSIQFLTYT